MPDFLCLPQVNDTGVTLIGNVTDPNAGIGFFVSAIDSTNGTRLIVGASRNSVGPLYNAGVAYFFAVDTVEGTLNQTCGLTRMSPSSHEMFGASVGISGRWLVVGAPEFDGEAGQGAVDLYKVCPPPILSFLFYSFFSF